MATNLFYNSFQRYGFSDTTSAVIQYYIEHVLTFIGVAFSVEQGLFLSVSLVSSSCVFFFCFLVLLVILFLDTSPRLLFFHNLLILIFFFFLCKPFANPFQTLSKHFPNTFKHFETHTHTHTRTGALTQTYCALSDEIPKNNIRGQFFVPIAGSAPHDEHVNNRTLTSNLYEMSLRLTEEFVGVMERNKFVYNNDD